MFAKLTYKRFLLHFLFWMFYLAFFGLFLGKYSKNFNHHLLETFVMLPFIMVAVYTTIYGILPYYLRTQKLMPGMVAVIILLGLVTMGEYVSLRLLNKLSLNWSSLIDVTFIYLLLETNFMVGIAVVIRFNKIWYNKQETMHRTEKRNLENELNLLRTQLNPHFLFNTMNNLYALSLENNTKTSEGIAKISDLLRAVLYECNEREILLDKEIELIMNYIDLEKMRYGERLKLDFNIEGIMQDMMIAPMVLFTFVENCFKHNSSKGHDQPFIRIDLQVDEKQLIFKAKNETTVEDTISFRTHRNGIGLNNVKKRLEILYPGKYELNYGFNNCCFEVYLRLMR